MGAIEFTKIGVWVKSGYEYTLIFEITHRG
jgi:hypothetical protein